MSDSFYSVTVVGRQRRADVSLPADVPISELLGELVSLLDEEVGGAPPSWGLVRVGGDVLDGEQSLTAQGVRAGVLLFLRDLADPAPPPAVDDYANAVAAAIEAAPGLWSPVRLQALLVGAGVAWLLALGGLTLVLVGRGVVAATPVALLAALAGTGTAGLVGRLAGFRMSGMALGFGVLPLWAAAGVGFGLGAGLNWTSALAVGLGAVAAGGLGARLAAPEATAPAAGVVAATAPLALTLAACARLGVPIATGAAVLVPFVLVSLRLLPRVVVRLTGLDVVPELGPLPGRAVAARQLLGSLTAGLAVALAAACVVLALEPGAWARPLAVAAGLAALLQARRGRLIVDVVPLVLVGLATLATLELPFAVDTLRRPDQVQGPAVLLGTAAVLVVVGLRGRHRRLPVGIRRQLGRLEALAAAATVPLALGMVGLYTAAQAFAGRFT